MRIVIDANTLSLVFNKHNKEHIDFRPVLRCITNGKGVMVYGGSYYEKELRRAGRIRRFIAELHRAGKIKIKVLNSTEVDKEEERLRKTVKTSRFDDQHIIAIVIVGICKVICSSESKAISFFKDRRLYPKNFKVPKIYSRSEHTHLLSG
jgi:hypothetical protein